MGRPRDSVVDKSARDTLLEQVSKQNSRLQRLIESIPQLIARSHDVLRHPWPEDSASSRDANRSRE
jgi:hypothetical protein